MVSTAARLAGWLRVAPEFPALVRFLKRTVSQKGMNSPRTAVDLYRFINVYSPGAADRILRKVRPRANGILAAYGLKVSYKSLAIGLCRYPGRPGKAAREAAARTIADLRVGSRTLRDALGVWPWNAIEVLVCARGLAAFLKADAKVKNWVLDQMHAGEFGDIREAMEGSLRLVQDCTDGVPLVLDPNTRVVKHGVELTIGWTVGERYYPRRLALCRQTKTGRTYHSEEVGYEANPSRLKKTVGEAITAWRKQAEMERRKSETLALFSAATVSWLVLVEDARSAGNCWLGITSWMAQRGWSGRCMVGVHQLLPYLQDPRVMNTVKAATQRISREQQQRAA